MNLIQIENVSKNFGEFKAVDNVSFNIEKGSVYGLLGPNGAGKTTTIRMVMDIIAPDSGKIIFQRKSAERRFCGPNWLSARRARTLSKNEGEGRDPFHGRVKRDEPHRRL